MSFQELIELVGKAVDVGGVGIVVVGVLVATVLALRILVKRQKGAYESYRRLLGRSILLGLEFLVAADIIRTVAVRPTFRSVGVLAVIVVIRTFSQLLPRAGDHRPVALAEETRARLAGLTVDSEGGGSGAFVAGTGSQLRQRGIVDLLGAVGG